MKPDFIEALKNLSQAYWVTGEKALFQKEYQIVKTNDPDLALEIEAFIRVTSKKN